VLPSVVFVLAHPRDDLLCKSRAPSALTSTLPPLPSNFRIFCLLRTLFRHGATSSRLQSMTCELFPAQRRGVGVQARIPAASFASRMPSRDENSVPIPASSLACPEERRELRASRLRSESQASPLRPGCLRGTRTLFRFQPPASLVLRNEGSLEPPDYLERRKVTS
jgi:hypothetical protein